MVAVTVNAREAAWMITKLLSSPLAEARELGLALRDEGRKICPTLLRHADANAFLTTAADLAATAAASVPAGPASTGVEAGNGVRLVGFTPGGLDHLLGLWLAENGTADLATTLRHVAGLPEPAKLELLGRLHAAMGPHDIPPRAFEGLHYTFEVTVDYGAFRDIQRHRIGLQLNPRLDTSLGFETPDEIVEAGLEPAYHEQMERAADLYGRAASRFPVQAQYLLPLAWRKRVVFDWNLREVAHFVRLRSSPQGHISYRRLAWQLRDAVVAAHPFAAPFLPVDRNRYALGRLEAHGRVE
jgi:thymidylate synthase ThyX